MRTGATDETDEIGLLVSLISSHHQVVSGFSSGLRSDRGVFFPSASSRASSRAAAFTAEQLQRSVGFVVTHVKQPLFARHRALITVHVRCARMVMVGMVMMGGGGGGGSGGVWCTVDGGWWMVYGCVEWWCFVSLFSAFCLLFAYVDSFSFRNAFFLLLSFSLSLFLQAAARTCCSPEL